MRSSDGWDRRTGWVGLKLPSFVFANEYARTCGGYCISITSSRSQKQEYGCKNGGTMCNRLGMYHHQVIVEMAAANEQSGDSMQLPYVIRKHPDFGSASEKCNHR